MTTTTTPRTVAVALGSPDGSVRRLTVPARWYGDALAIHAPIRDGAATTARGLWAITHWPTGWSAGIFRGPLRDAVALARLWDTGFSDALSASDPSRRSLADWPQARAWSRQLVGDAPRTGPVAPNHGDYNNGDLTDRAPVAAADGDGAEQFPATVTLSAVTVDGERRVRFARRLPDGRERLRDPSTGAAVRMDGDVAAFGPTARLRLWFGGAWRDIPSIAECMEWSLDGVAETPDGSRTEPDAPNSWLTLLALN